MGCAEGLSGFKPPLVDVHVLTAWLGPIICPMFTVDQRPRSAVVSSKRIPASSEAHRSVSLLAALQGNFVKKRGKIAPRFRGVGDGMTEYCVLAPTPLLPDPDEKSQSKLILNVSDTLSVKRTLDTWSQVFLTREDKEYNGWVPTEKLSELTVNTIKLFDEPFGQLLTPATGRVELITSVADWVKVKVSSSNGEFVVGWAQGIPHPQEPVGQPESIDLVLGVNERYRSDLIEAQQRTGIDAAAIAALISAEAGTIKKGPDAGLWDPQSSNSEAIGLTQFFPETWCAMACLPGSLLNSAAVKSQMVADRQVVPDKRDALLRLRFDPELSIVSAAEYGAENLKRLQQDGLVSPDAGDDERAWFIYLAHHEGPTGAEQFLRHDGSVSFEKFVAQLGGDRAKAAGRIQSAGGDVTLAYRTWLTSYINERIQPSRFRTATSPNQPLRPTTRALAGFTGAPLPIQTLHTRPDLVLEIQQSLADLGYLDPPPDGLMGPTSLWALNEFCKQNELVLEGGFTRDIATTLLSPRFNLPHIQPGGGWMDKIMQHMSRMNYFICRHPGCKNIIYLEGVNSDGTLNDNKPNYFDALRLVFSIGANGVPIIEKSWDATTRPGTHYTDHPLNRSGAAIIALDQYKSWAAGIYHGYEALLQVAPIKIYRDVKDDYQREGEVYLGLWGIHQHWGYNYPHDDIENASAGCLVGRTTLGHLEFINLVKSDPRYMANHSYKFITAVISGADALKN
jgi:hypothetical protein